MAQKDKKRRIRTNSLFFKITGLSAIMVAGLMALTSYEYTKLGLKLVANEVIGSAGALNQINTDMLASSIRFSDADAISSRLETSIFGEESTALEGVAVNKSGEIIVTAGTDSAYDAELADLARQAIAEGEVVRSADGFSVASPATYGRNLDVVGALATRWSVERAQAAARQQNLYVMAIVGAIAGLGLLAMIFFIRRWVTKPVAGLVHNVDGIASENYDVVIPSINRGDELGDISRSVDHLREQLQAGAEQAKQSRFRGAAFEASGAAMMMVDDALKITQINRAGITLFSENRDNFRSVAADFDPDQMIGYDVASFHPRLSASELSELLSDPENLPYEDEIGVGDLRLRLAISAVRDEHGASIGYVVEWMDETEEYLNRAVMGALDKSQIRADFSAEGELLSGNEIVQKAWNITEDQMSSMPPLQDVSEPLYRDMQKGNVVYDVFPGPVRSDGEQVLTDGAFAPVMDEQGKLMRIVLIGQDVTDARKAMRISEEQREAMQAAQAKVVTALQEGLEQLALGNLTAQIDETFDAEYEQLRNDYNQALGRLLEAMRGVVENADLIQGEAAEISNAADDLSLRTEKQAATLEETASAIDELTSSVQSAAEGAAHANELVENARKNAEASGEVVREAVSAMGEIENSSQQIGKITSVIDDIAFQTNLLALNAGVEAARAGEAGRGFAVVASEVRALAQRSSDAAREINELISSSGAQVKRGVDLVDQAGNALRGIVDSVKEIAENVSAIAVSSKEQSSGLVEINEAMNQLDQVTQQNAAMFEETTAASHALTR
ncbi:MAG: methyl-accepting chemotaxis protein, partial [Maritimibacter sp.]